MVLKMDVKPDAIQTHIEILLFLRLLKFQPALMLAHK